MAQADPVAHAWAQRVVAWHNRHPLARRIGAADLSVPGHVELPFSADRKRRLFSERLLPRLSIGSIARLARREGSAVAPDDALPRRLVVVDPKRVGGQEALQPLWLATVAVGCGRDATRVLIGSRSVLGRRLWSRPRLLLLAGALLVAAWLPRLPELADLRPSLLAAETSGAAAAPKEVDAAHEAAPTEAEHAADAAPAAAAHDADADAHDATAIVAHADSAAGEAESHADAEPVADAAGHDADEPERAAELHAAPAAAHDAVPARDASTHDPHAAATTAGRVAVDTVTRAAAPQPFPPRRPQLDAETKAAAREAVARARAARAVAAGGTIFALATPRVRTQAESELMADALRSAAAAIDAPRGWHVEVLPAGDDWRAVGWPFARAEDAERLRDRIAARGLRIELIAF